jgi:hypothetical protein
MIDIYRDPELKKSQSSMLKGMYCLILVILFLLTVLKTKEVLFILALKDYNLFEGRLFDRINTSVYIASKVSQRSLLAHYGSY